ncbi:MAG: sodium/proline symporter [Clostridia bacterium]|nr:sodium/proline symporter [Clostridia bacterium]
MASSQIIMLVAIVAYLLMMLVIGYIYSKKNKDSSDFYLGGRKLSPLVAAMSAEASDMSSWLLMGLPGIALAGSIAEASWTAIGLAMGTYLNWLIVAKRIRVYTSKCGAITIPEFFHKRYNDNSKILRTVAALAIIIFFIPYTASGFSACGKLFSTLFGADYVTTMIISAVVIVAYTTMGGFLAASTTDLIQSVVMTFALVFVLIFGISKAGGMGAVVENAKSLEGYFTLFKQNVGGVISPYGGLTIASTLAWGLGYFGMPHILLRFMAINDEHKVKTSRRVASVWVVIAMAVAILIGVVGFSLEKNGTVAGLVDKERIIILLANVISEYGVLFAIIGGVVLSGILASTMSTADSQLLTAASGISEDIAKGVFGIKLSSKKSMIIARCTVILISIIAIILALNENSSVFRIVSFAWAGFGASFGPVILLALFWKRSNKYGAIAGMIAGAVMIFVWKFVIAKLGGLFAIYELLPAFVIGLVVNVIVSLLTKAPEKEVTDVYDEVNAEMAK